MTCAEFKEVAAALALDALDADERAEARAHLSEPRHEGCIEAFARATVAAGRLAGVLPDVEPPGRVWRAIAARISARPPRRRRAVASGWIAAAAAVVVAALLAGKSARLQRDLDATRSRSATAETGAASAQDLFRRCAAELEAARKTSGLAREAIALLEQRGSRVVAFAPQAGFGTPAMAVVGQGGRRAILLASALAPTPSRDFQLWVIPPGKGAAPVPAGLVAAAEGIALGDFQTSVLARGAAALAVSAEPKGGSKTGKPTEVVLVAALGG